MLRCQGHEEPVEGSVRMIRKMLEAGARPAREVYAEGKRQGYSASTVYRAAGRLGVRSRSTWGKVKAVWSLPMRCKWSDPLPCHWTG
jgi:hypothetical protein